MQDGKSLFVERLAVVFHMSHTRFRQFVLRKKNMFSLHVKSFECLKGHSAMHSASGHVCHYLSFSSCKNFGLWVLQYAKQKEALWKQGAQDMHGAGWYSVSEARDTRGGGCDGVLSGPICSFSSVLWVPSSACTLGLVAGLSPRRRAEYLALRSDLCCFPRHAFLCSTEWDRTSRRKQQWAQSHFLRPLRSFGQYRQLGPQVRGQESHVGLEPVAGEPIPEVDKRLVLYLRDTLRNPRSWPKGRQVLLLIH